MDKLIVDANILVKWFIQEKNSNIALMIRDKFLDGKVELIIPHFLFYQVLNALKYSGLFTREEINNAGVSLENYRFTSKRIQGEIRESMVKIAIRHNISIYDAAYIALSINWGEIFCTADEKIIKKLPEELKKNVKNLNEISEKFSKV
ncbi:MAG: type II toxin-antitoxin system VapC family toxin [Promethearchaeia archaeon]